MTEQAKPAEQHIPQPDRVPHSPVDRVRDGVVGFLKSRLPGEKTRRSMDIVDKLTSRLPPERQELAAKLRPIVQKGLYAGNVVGTTAEAMLVASVALGGTLVVKEAFSIAPGQTKRKGMSEVLKKVNVKKMPQSFLIALGVIQKSETPDQPPSKNPQTIVDPIRLPPVVQIFEPTVSQPLPLQQITWDSIGGVVFSHPELLELTEDRLKTRLRIIDSDIKDAPLRLDLLPPYLLKHFCSNIALLGDDEKRNFALAKLMHDGVRLWTQYRADGHPPESDTYTIRSSHVHFDTFYQWLLQRREEYEPSWIHEFLNNDFKSADALLRGFANKTGFSLRAHLSLLDQSPGSDVDQIKKWVKRWYDEDLYQA